MFLKKLKDRTCDTLNNKKGNALLIALVIVLIVLMLVIAAFVAYIIVDVNKDDDDVDETGSRLEAMKEEQQYQTTVAMTETTTEAPTEAPTEATTEATHGSISLDNNAAQPATPAQPPAQQPNYYPGYEGQSVKTMMFNLMNTYATSLCGAINTGDYSIVSPYIEAGSPLESMQRSLVSNLYSQGITESYVGATVDNYVLSDDGMTCTIYVTESEDIMGTSKGTYTDTYNWTYTAHYQGGVWRMTNLQ